MKFLHLHLFHEDVGNIRGYDDIKDLITFLIKSSFSIGFRINRSLSILQDSSSN
jgi:hypothetical protein